MVCFLVPYNSYHLSGVPALSSNCPLGLGHVQSPRDSDLLPCTPVESWLASQALQLMTGAFSQQTIPCRYHHGSYLT